MSWFKNKKGIRPRYDTKYIVFYNRPTENTGMGTFEAYMSSKAAEEFGTLEAAQACAKAGAKYHKMYIGKIVKLYDYKSEIVEHKYES